MKVMVTGGNGFVATHLIQQLLDRGDTVIATVRTIEKGEQLTGLFPTDKFAYILSALTDFPDLALQEEMLDTGVLFHVASPLGDENPNNPLLIEQATTMVQAVFDNAAAVGLKRIIMTSSQAAATPKADSTGIFDESFWSDESNLELNAYRLSKVKAEKLAWTLADENNLQLTTILPGAIFGPVLTPHLGSNGLIAQIIHGTRLPKINLEISDVRDVARLHVLAAATDKSVSQRYIAKNGDLTFQQVAELLKTEFPTVQTKTLPDFVIRLAAIFMKPLRALTPMLGRRYTHTNQKAINQLGYQPMDPEATILDAAERLKSQFLL